MATTTNYGWTTPDNTALVKDGASAIRTLGSSVDTSLKSLSPGTTAGDVDYYTSSTAKAGLAIGSTGQVLTVAAGVPSWATSSSGGMVLISTTTLSGATTILSSIPQTYNNLFLIVEGVTGNTSDQKLRVYPNGSGTFYGVENFNGAVTTYSNNPVTPVPTTTLRTSANNAWQFTFNNYTSSTKWKPVNYYGAYTNPSSIILGVQAGGVMATNTAITSINLDYGGTNTFSGGTVYLYGEK